MISLRYTTELNFFEPRRVNHWVFKKKLINSGDTFRLSSLIELIMIYFSQNENIFRKIFQFDPLVDVCVATLCASYFATYWS